MKPKRRLPVYGRLSPVLKVRSSASLCMQHWPIVALLQRRHRSTLAKVAKQQHCHQQAQNFFIGMSKSSITLQRCACTNFNMFVNVYLGNSWNYKKISDTSNQTSGGMIISGGNFHGEYPAKVQR